MVLAFRRLNEYLEGIFDLRELDCVMYIAPFHDVVVSNQFSGPLTCAALSSLSKFVMFGFMSLDYPRIREGIALVAHCVARCLFEETDWESDAIILMKLLELATLVLRCDASSLLSVSAVWNIFLACITIYDKNPSSVLRSEAETALRHLTLITFSRAPAATQKHLPKLTVSLREIIINWDDLSQNNFFAGSVGIVLLLTKLITVYSGLLDLQAQPVQTVKLALSLVNIGLEAGGPSLGLVGPLVDVLRGDVCRHLLKASQSDDLAVFSLTLRVVFNLFMSIKDHMKTQLEVFLTSVHLRLLLGSQQAPSSLSLAKEELALESLLEFCREPSLMQDIYANYDCDEQCTNLFDSIICTLSSRCIPGGMLNSVSDGPLLAVAQDPHAHTDGSPQKSGILTRLALYGVTTVVRAVAARCGAESLLVVLSRENTPTPSVGGPTPASFDQTSDPGANLVRDSVLQGFSGGSIKPANTDQQVDNWCAAEPEKLDGERSMRDVTPQKSAAATVQYLDTRMLLNPRPSSSDDVNSVGSSPFAASESHFHRKSDGTGIRKRSSTSGVELGDDLDLSDVSDSDSDIALITRARSVEVRRAVVTHSQR
jgi:hypothetical protein